MASTCAGYKRAAKHFNLPVDTVKTWGRRARDEGSAASRARAPAREPRPKAGSKPRPAPSPAVERDVLGEVLEDDEPLDTDEVELELGAWDPTKCSRKEWLERAIVRCLERADEAMAQSPPHGGVARQWEVSAGAYRDELDELLDEERAAELAAGRSASMNTAPSDLARRVLKLVKVLIHVAPAEAEAIHAELGRLLEAAAAS